MLNGALLILSVYFILVFAQEGMTQGSEFAAQMTAEKESREIEFTLEEETGRMEVAAMLEELGVINNQYLFVLELFLKNSSTSYRAGTYTLDPSMSNTMINATLRRRPQSEIVHDQIRIPEGFSIRDIAVYLEGRGFFTAEEFIEAADNFESFFSFIYDIPDRPNRLEGYLFPDTYFITPEPTPNEIIYKMLARFDEIYNYEYRHRAYEMGMSMDEIIIIASMIEKEVRVADERARVAQVIYNRLAAPMRLQIDATVIYALDKPRNRLTFADYEVQSPYNTYVIDGLPIGPIGNPGLNCIRAALYPEEGNYLYYVVNNLETGSHHFSTTYEEHLRARDRYLQMLED
jgi:UPF0755 protein